MALTLAQLEYEIALTLLLTETENTVPFGQPASAVLCLAKLLYRLDSVEAGMTMGTRWDER